jgi:hypothetical protein
MRPARIALGDLKYQSWILVSWRRRIPANTGNQIPVLQRICVPMIEITQLAGLLLKENK